MFKSEKIGLIIAGIVFLILGFLTLGHPEHTFVAIIFMVGILNVINALVSIYIAYNTGSKEIRGREILNAFLSGIVGLIFLFSKETGADTIALMFAFWIIFISISNMTIAFSGLGIGGFTRILYVLIGVFGLYAGIGLLLNWGVSAASFIWFVGFFLIAQGVASIVSGFLIPSDD
ncbi:DUF308 domain-containing protein [Streptococcaceae bacterium ESL0687]|nr:DUF308 domain-containing protein [Streptococcaceae bacterium ESL0687]